ncbi:MAG: hypothetical protein P8R42_09855 [Candidatus Binatia bacterium]|nr:hypothetical protein [Candidatus Binatia bacterium]
MERPLSRNANRPLLSNVPTGMLQAGRNVVRIRLVVEPAFSGILDPVLIGPHAVLQPSFETQSTFTVLVPQIVATLCLAVALLILGVFVRDDDEGANPWFAAAFILWAVVLTQGFLRDPPAMPSRRG